MSTKKTTWRIQHKIKNIEAEFILNSKTISEELVSHRLRIEWGGGEAETVYGDCGAAVDGKDESFEC